MRLPVRHRVIRPQRVHPPHHFVDGSKAEFGHDLPQFFGDHEAIAHHMVGCAGELGAQIRILRGDAHRAGVQVALAHHDAAEGDEGRGGETELLRAEQRRDCDIAPGLQLTIGLQHHARTEVVHHQHLMRLRDAEFPRHAGVLDGRERRCARAATVPGDDQVIRAGFHHAGGDGADTDGGAEFHADARVGIAVLQVVNELRDVLDGIDVVVRRRADETNARRGMANRSDHVVHFAARQFAALAGLGALHDLDLQLVGVCEVVRGDAEAPARHLLDGGAFGIPVRKRHIAFGILAAFAGVGLAADAVHGDGEALVRFFGNGTETHRAGGEPFDDFLLRLHLGQRNRPAGRVLVEVQQSPQRGVAGALLVGVPGESPIGVFVILARRHLQVGDGFRIPHVRVAMTAPMEIAWVRQHRRGGDAAPRKADRVAALHFLGQHVKAHALHAARRAAETPLHHFVRKPDRLENLRALVGLQGGNAHLGHHLQHAFADAFAVRLHHVRIGADMICIGQIACSSCVPQRLEREIGIHGVRPEPHQQAMVMHFPRFAGLHHDADPGAARGAHQVVMHGASGGQGADRHALVVGGAVRKHQQRDAIVNRRRGVLADAGHGVQQALPAGVAREGDVDGTRTPTAVVQVLDRREFLVRENRLRQAQAVGVCFGDVEKVALWADVTFERHHHLFADGVDGGIGHLRE